MDLLNSQKHFLSLLLHTSRTQGTGLLKSLTDEQVRILTEITINLLEGNLPAPIQRLRRYKSILREISSSTKSIKKNGRKIRNEAGRWFAILQLLKPSLVKVLSP